MIREYVVKVTDALVPDAFQRFENEWSPEQELIRCKDCKYWNKDIEACDNSDSACFHNGWCKPDFFCADGERAAKS